MQKETGNQSIARAIQIGVGHQTFHEPLQSLLHQRAVAIHDWADANREWGAWWRVPDHGRSTLCVFWDSTKGLKARSSVSVDEIPPPPGGVWRIDISVSDSPSNYDGLDDPQAITLRFVATVDALLTGVADRFERPHPSPLPRTRRERDWVNAGHAEPSPSAFLARPLLDSRATVEAMPAAEFWAIMNSLSGDTEHREHQLLGKLRKLRLPQIAGFHARYVQATNALYTRTLWSTAKEAMGWSSDDVFTDLRCWIVAQGQTPHNAVLMNPSELRAILAATDLEEIGAAEGLGYAPSEMYAARTGRSLGGDYKGIEPHEQGRPPK